MKTSHSTVSCNQYKTTRLPGILLRIKGRLDSRNGINAVETFVERMIHKVYVLENREYMLADQCLKEDRNDAANALSVLSEKPDNIGSDSKIAMQHNLSIASKRSHASTRIIDTYERLCHVHALVEEHCMRIRNYNDAKLQQYFSGVTLDYNKDYSYSDDAKDRYLEHHKACDDAVKEFASNAYSLGEG